MKKLVIFGTGEIAELANYYFAEDSEYEVVAFTVDSAYMKEGTKAGLPVVAFEEVARAFPAETYEMFIAISYAKLNAVRRNKYFAAAEMGYKLATYLSSKATVLNNGQIGANCFILEDNTVQPFSRIGNNVTLWSGNHIGHHSQIGDHSFIASQVVISGGVTIGEQCFIGVNATLRDHITIGDRCLLGAGSLLLTDAEPEGVYLAPASERSRVPSTRIRNI
ncbi:acetyltransferase [Roseobacter sp. S98]|uniref:acetyltransferase n=1 Tax=Roseobacter algicola (ex Choi et al. 2025) (nom. illeg.) TaxID=3092138 RepID=UPI0035C70A29